MRREGEMVQTIKLGYPATCYVTGHYKLTTPAGFEPSLLVQLTHLLIDSYVESKRSM